MEENKKVIVAGACFLILLAVIVVVYLVFFRGGGEPAPEAVSSMEQSAETAEQDPVPPGESQEAVDQIEVELGQSDELVRELVGTLSADPDLARWLLTENLVRRFVAAVDNIANGQSPRSHLGFLQIPDKFSAIEEDGALILDPRSYRRYNTVAEVFDSVEAEGAVGLYRRMTSVFQEAYADLGYPEASFHTTLLHAIDELLEVPVMQGDVILEEKLRSYALADSRLEEMSQAQKHLFRMGPRNVERIQSKLRLLKSRLGDS